jgi:hypothetical protein
MEMNSFGILFDDFRGWVGAFLLKHQQKMFTYRHVIRVKRNSLGG